MGPKGRAVLSGGLVLCLPPSRPVVSRYSVSVLNGENPDVLTFCGSPDMSTNGCLHTIDLTQAVSALLSLTVPNAPLLSACTLIVRLVGTGAMPEHLEVFQQADGTVACVARNHFACSKGGWADCRTLTQGC